MKSTRKGPDRLVAVEPSRRLSPLRIRPGEACGRSPPGRPVRPSRRQCPCRPSAFRRHLDRHPNHPQNRRPGRIPDPAPPLGGRALLRLNQPKPTTRQELRGDRRLGRGLPLRRLGHTTHPQIGPTCMSFESDSKREFQPVRFRPRSSFPKPCAHGLPRRPH